MQSVSKMSGSYMVNEGVYDMGSQSFQSTYSRYQDDLNGLLSRLSNLLSQLSAQLNNLNN